MFDIAGVIITITTAVLLSKGLIAPSRKDARYMATLGRHSNVIIKNTEV